MEERRKGNTEILNKLNELSEESKNVAKILNGNGKIGLVGQVKINTDFRESTEKFHKDMRWLIIKSVISLMITIIISNAVSPWLRALFDFLTHKGGG